MEATTPFNYYDDPKDNLAFERCIEVMSRLMMKYGPALLERMSAYFCVVLHQGMRERGSQALWKILGLTNMIRWSRDY